MRTHNPHLYEKSFITLHQILSRNQQTFPAIGKSAPLPDRAAFVRNLDRGQRLAASGGNERDRDFRALVRLWFCFAWHSLGDRCRHLGIVGGRVGRFEHGLLRLLADLFARPKEGAAAEENHRDDCNEKRNPVHLFLAE